MNNVYQYGSVSCVCPENFDENKINVKNALKRIKIRYGK